MIDTSKGFKLASMIKANPEEIWKAWTDADSAERW